MLSRDLGTQYKTAFVLSHKIREAMAFELRGMNVGGEGKIVEVDGMYAGGYVKPANMTVKRFFVQRMKTKWGSCSPERQGIRLNTELARKPPACLEYIVVHEMAHLIERHHNDRFGGLLSGCLPHWRQVRQVLNGAPLSHADWRY